MSSNVEDIDRQLLRKYEVVQKLGRYCFVVSPLHSIPCRGAYGVVWKAVSRKTGENVAIKKCFDAFQNATGTMNS